ncbi:MAG TPA: Gfo/Idh/MocA family oxidoreductase [Nitrospirae bacterium]|nr:Gfo/Idh/MocA family oxidoreductase [Nitrospirota bacterium]
MIKVGVIGYGYWGPNVVRNFCSQENVQVTSVCDKDLSRLKPVKKMYPAIELIYDYHDIIDSNEIDAIAIVTPVSTHYELAKKSLQNGKHVFVEKPFTATVAQAEELIGLAEKKNLKIMVDHTFLFTGAVKKIRQVIDEGVLGDIYYYDSTRVNLGLFQHDVNVIWDLAPHDFSVMDYLIDEKPLAVNATGKSHVSEYEDVAYITAHFQNNIIAHFNVNWLSPVKVRSTLLGCQKKMLVWNDVNVDEKIKIYDKGVKVKKRESIYDLLVSYRSGDIWTPKVEQQEALGLETEYFVDCIVNDNTPINDGHAGLQVVKMLNACDKSLKNNGRLVKL